MKILKSVKMVEHLIFVIKTVAIQLKDQMGIKKYFVKESTK
jgi:hypothetical protein